jgi:extracellular solute-binding protein
MGVDMPRFALACISLFSLIIPVEMVHSAELNVFASRAVWTVLREVGQEFEQKTGHKLVLTTGLSFHYVDQFNAGEFDVIAAPPPELDRLIKSDKLIASSKVDLVRSVVGVVVRAGAPKPDVSSVEAFKQTLLRANSITYLPTPGVPLMLERLGPKLQFRKPRFPRNWWLRERLSWRLFLPLKHSRRPAWSWLDHFRQRFGFMAISVVRSVQHRRCLTQGAAYLNS